MSVDIRALLAYTMLDLCHHKPLSKITVSELLNITGIGRRTFYSYFCDKQELIAWIYESRMITPAVSNLGQNEFYLESQIYYDLLKENSDFLIQACKMSDQNCLSEYMYHAAELRMFKLAEDSGVLLDETLKMQIRYHVHGMVNLSVEWITSGMQESPKYISNVIRIARCSALVSLLPFTASSRE